MTFPSGPWLGTELKVVLGEPAEHHIGKVHRPDAVAALLQPDVLVLERSAQEDLPTPEANRPRRAHKPNFVMARVLRLRQHPRILAPRRMPPAGRRLLAQRLVGPLVIVGGAKRFELSLLARAGRRGRSGCLRLQRPVHALMGAVLLRMARLGP